LDAVLRNFATTAPWGISGCAALMSAATPAAWGAAIELPFNQV
jgi:hypothetical protein